MRMRAARRFVVPVLLAVAPLAAGCQMLAFPDEILPTDKVQNEQQAILLAQQDCGPGTSSPDAWEARLEGGTWKAWWSYRQSEITVEIDKKTGEFRDCHVDLVPN